MTLVEGEDGEARDYIEIAETIPEHSAMTLIFKSSGGVSHSPIPEWKIALLSTHRWAHGGGD